MMKPNSGRVTTIVENIRKQKTGGAKPGGREEGEREEHKPETDTMAAKMAAMDSFIVATEKKDARGMVRALETFHEICKGYGDEEEEPEEPKTDISKPYSSPQYQQD